MSEENTTAEETTTTEGGSTETETTVEVEATPEPVVETAPTPKPDVGDKFDQVSGSTGTGKQVFSGMCKLCSARIASGVLDKEGKVRCPTCNGTF